jgi:dynein heavy chain
LPGEYQDKFDIFEKLIVVKIFKPEKLMFGFSNYVENKIGKYYLEIPSINMNEIYIDTDVKTPIIFVLSSGADPTSLIYGLAKDKNFSNNLLAISLG